MQQRRPPALQQQYLQQLLRALSGSHEKAAMLVIVSVIVLLGWLGGSVQNLLEATSIRLIYGFLFGLISDSAVIDDSVIAVPIVLGTLALIALAVLFYRATRFGETLHFMVTTNPSPAAAQALILYLSNPGEKDVALIDSLNGDVADLSIRKQFRGPWRIALEAIAYHKPILREVIVIPSADSHGHTGSHGYVELFKSLVARLGNGSAPRVRCIGEFMPDYLEGVDFENMETLYEVTSQLFSKLIDEGLSQDAIVVDITSGNKVTTTTGTIIALAEGRRFQYINSTDHAVVTYSSGYEVA